MCYHIHIILFKGTDSVILMISRNECKKPVNLPDQPKFNEHIFSYQSVINAVKFKIQIYLVFHKIHTDIETVRWKIINIRAYA